ncbi:hypothetical protein FrCorBMG51_06215 [Protofrankia coriariae]|uniref:Uncharacterized protein n=1 Tax=Protofrankia coriariae TaxID=1562887 RepID=A0ABR5F6C5_9ACTN|nr:hypothetical protein FrCorBMG51_06215 [Protofrankia coriariae]
MLPATGADDEYLHRVTRYPLPPPGRSPSLNEPSPLDERLPLNQPLPLNGRLSLNGRLPSERPLPRDELPLDELPLERSPRPERPLPSVGLPPARPVVGGRPRPGWLCARSRALRGNRYGRARGTG